MIDVVVPDLGLSEDDNLTVSCWLVRRGDEVVEGDRLVELLCGEITFDVPSPATGLLHRIVSKIDDAVSAGDVLGKINEDSSP